MNKTELKTNGVLKFNREHDMSQEAFEVELHYGTISSWDDPFKLFVNSELVATFKSFTGIKNRAEAIIAANGLQQASPATA